MFEFQFVLLGFIDSKQLKNNDKTFIKANLTKSDDQTNIDKYRGYTCNITEYHIRALLFIMSIKTVKHNNCMNILTFLDLLIYALRLILYIIIPKIIVKSNYFL